MAEKITLVGGGLSGGLLSVFLARKGYEVHVYERRPDMRQGNYQGGRSINLALSTRGIRGLEKAGIAKDIMEIAIPMTGRMMHDRAGNLAYQPYGKDGQAIYSVSRGALNIRLLQLADAFPNIHMYFDHKCIFCDPESGITRYTDANGNVVEDKAVIFIGTDGAFSAVRDAFMTSKFNYAQTYEDHGYKELEITPDENGEFCLQKNSLHIWPRTSFMMIALPNPGGNFTCTLFMPFEGENSFATLTTPEQVMTFFNKEFGDTVDMMPGLVDDFFGNPTGTLVTMRCYPWIKQRAALLGDSAHAIIPFYGQGMNCCFEDCIVMDELITAHKGNWSKALDDYQKSRKPNADAIASLAIQNFVEMRDLVGTEAFRHRKHVEHDLTELYPDLFKSQYELTTFHTTPYKYALDIGVKNDKLLNHIIQGKLEDRLTDKAFMEPLIRQMLAD
ncbi:MAG: FAD-dependent monooxygenase [Bacteroidetes bacterium]|nr:FAD-dependent monooxygenase [Bacteroidota bacterium]